MSKSKKLPHVKTDTQINANCRRCPLHSGAKHVCLRGRNADSHKRLLVYLDHPDYYADHIRKPFAFETGKFLEWCFKRMSIDPKKVAFDYTLRCYPDGNLPGSKAERAALIEECSSYRFATIRRVQPKVVVVLGKVSLEAFTGFAGNQFGRYNERRHPCWEPVVRDSVSHVWVGYSVSYVLTQATDSYQVFRVLFVAAQEAGLNPEINPNVPPFKWRNIK